MKVTLHTAVAGSGKMLSWSRFLLICLFSPIPSVSLLIQSPPLGIAPASVPSPRYRSCFSPLPSVSLLIQSPRRRGGRRAGATEEGRALCAGATEGAGAARVPRRGRAPRGCHGIAPDSVPSPRYLVSLQHRPQARKQKLSRNKQISKSRTRFQDFCGAQA